MPPPRRRPSTRSLVPTPAASASGRDQLLERIHRAVTDHAEPTDVLAHDRGETAAWSATTSTDGRLALDILTGTSAGASFPLRPGRFTIGRADDADLCLVDPSVSRHHAVVDVGVDGQVSIRDQSSTNGTTVEGAPLAPSAALPVGQVARFGTVAVSIRVRSELSRGDTSRGDTDRPSDVPPRPFNRPPRLAPPPSPEPLEIPPTPDASSVRPPFGWAMFSAPLVIGLVLAVTLSPVMALFSLLSPAMLIANWFEQRVRGRSGRRRRQAAYDDEISRFGRAVRLQHQLALTQVRSGEPSLAALFDRARSTAPQLWERRIGHGDYLSLTLGLADRKWAPLVRSGSPADPRHVPEPTTMLLAELGPLPDVPFTVQLGSGDIVSVIGPPSRTEAVVRQLALRTIILHGPADVRLVVDPTHRPAWRWVEGLPHLRAVGDLPDPGDESERPGTIATEATRWLVITDATELQQRAPLRRTVNARPDVAAVVMCTTLDEAPNDSSILVELDETGAARVSRPDTRETVDDVLVAACSLDQAIEVTASLAGLIDLDLDDPHTGDLPPVALLELLELEPGSGSGSGSGSEPGSGSGSEGSMAARCEQITSRWEETTTNLDAIVGRIDDGRNLRIDLIDDGPHALVGGTTGSGKSELLRTLIVALAVRHPPDRCAFLLFDFKGGSAFDACHRLPHVVGLVTDLDGGLAERALTAIDAEIRRREHLLRDAGVSDLAALRAAGMAAREGIEVFPALVVIVDEFATLAADAPDFVDRLIDVAQRGRSLGVHLVLATQRPSGVINDRIRANTDIRIALRVADAHDSTDIVGQPDAATIDRDHPGQACVRFGPNEVRTARFAHLPPEALAGLVSEISTAWDNVGRPTPAPVYLPPLPSKVLLDSIAPPCGAPTPRRGSVAEALGDVAVGLVDLPAQQRQEPWHWSPTGGTLLTIGMPGSGTTTVLRTAALAVVAAQPDVHLYAIDHDGSLSELEHLGQCGAVVPADELTRQRRLSRHLLDAIASRRTTASPDRFPILLVIDDLPGVLGRHDDVEGLRFCDAIGRIHRDGPALGIHLVAASSRVSGLPSSIVSTTRQRLVLALPDRFDYATLGLSGPTPSGARQTAATAVPPGRGLTAEGTAIQVATPDPALLDELAAGIHPARPPDPIRTLTSQVARHDLGPVATVDGRAPWMLPIALGDTHLAPCGIVLHPGEHALVSGPPRSGRTTALDTIAWAAQMAGVETLRTDGRTLDTSALLTDVLGGADRPLLVLIDDADRVTDTGGVLDTLVRTARPGLHVVAAGRPERLRSHFGDWISAIRESGVGLVLRPDVDLDGDLFGVRLPRRRDALGIPGRAYLVVDGTAELVQVASP